MHFEFSRNANSKAKTTVANALAERWWIGIAADIYDTNLLSICSVALLAGWKTCSETTSSSSSKTEQYGSDATKPIFQIHAQLMNIFSSLHRASHRVCHSIRCAHFGVADLDMRIAKTWHVCWVCISVSKGLIKIAYHFNWNRVVGVLSITTWNIILYAPRSSQSWFKLCFECAQLCGPRDLIWGI